MTTLHWWAGLVFTSQTAVEAVCVALAGSGVTHQLVEQWKGIPVFVVGKATAQAGEVELKKCNIFPGVLDLVVNELGLETFGSYSGNAETLSQVIIKCMRVRTSLTKHYPPPSPPPRFRTPRPERPPPVSLQ